MSTAAPIVAITGASRGIGRGCALAFAAQGAEVLLIARNAEQLEDLSCLAGGEPHDGGQPAH